MLYSIRHINRLMSSRYIRRLSQMFDRWRLNIAIKVDPKMGHTSKEIYKIYHWKKKQVKSNKNKFTWTEKDG